MKKTLFVASLLLCSLPAMAESGMTLSGEGIANNCTWNLFATFDSLAFTDTFTTLATVNLNNDKWEAMYAVGYTYSSTDNTLTLGMASYANPDSWMAVSSDGGITLSKENPVSFALSLNGSNEGGDNTLTLHAASGSTMENIAISDTIKTLKTDTYSNIHLSSVSLGTTSTATQLYNKPNGVVLTPATGNNVNIVSARLEHAAYSNTAFKEFILEEQPWADDETVRYTTVENGNQKNVYTYDTANGEVTFNPSKFTDNKLTLDSTTLTVKERTTFIVEDNKTVEISGPSNKNSAGSVTGGGELVKSGGGKLMLRLNDVERNVNYDGKNDFYGNVTVEEGTLHLLHTGTNSDTTSLFASIGGGTGDNGSVVTVKEGATLVLDNHTKISIPYGARTSPNESVPYYSVDITGGAVQSNDGKLSTIQDAIIDRNGIKLVDPEVRAKLAIEGIAIHDNRADGLSTVKKADIVTDEFVADGRIVFDNATLDALVVWTTGGYWDDTEEEQKKEEYEEEHTKPTTLHSATLQNNSHVKYSGETWGHMDNVYVDKTSSLTTKSAGTAL